MKPKAKQSKGSFLMTKGMKSNEEGEAYFIGMAHQMLLLSGFPDVPMVFSAAQIVGRRNFKKFDDEMKLKGVPDSISKLLEITQKKDANRLDGEHLVTSDDLFAFIYNCEGLGFAHTSWFEEYLPPNISRKDLPKVIHAKEGEPIEVVGETSLSEGQLKALMDQRKNTSVHFFTKGDAWHCFFFTHNDVRGKHGAMGGHAHYLSHLWGIPREDVESQLKQRDYSLSSIHLKWDMGERGEPVILKKFKK